MHNTYLNLSTAFESMLKLIANNHETMWSVRSRNGTCYRFDDPVVTTYQRPNQCVLFDPRRDANPFFHLVEALWMLAGRNDVKTVQRFASTIGQFSDDGETFWSAYGYRWRHHFGRDQLLDTAIGLAKDPNSRRELTVMWDGYKDRAVMENGGKDLSCNFALKFSIRGGRLNLTVFNRSNDLVWGCFGANAVHFAFLHMFMSTVLQVPLGSYHQISDDLHVYDEGVYGEKLFKSLFDKENGGSTLTAKPWGEHIVYNSSIPLGQKVHQFSVTGVSGVNSVHSFGRHHDSSVFDGAIELLDEVDDVTLRFKLLMGEITRALDNDGLVEGMSVPFLHHVYGPMMHAFLYIYKGQNDPEAAARFLAKTAMDLSVLEGRPGVLNDWLAAGAEWMQRRADARSAKK